MDASEGARLHRESYVLDLHIHGPGFVPPPFRTLWRAVNPRAPAEVGFEALRTGGVNAAVAKAIGDPIVTRWYRGRSPWDAVEVQLAQIERQAAEAGAVVVDSTEGLTRARSQDALAVMLGIEGGDALGHDVDRVDAWYERGVRMIVLVHVGDNTLGTTSLPWQRYVGPMPVRGRRAPGLTQFGVRVVERMNQRGVLVDVAHCDPATVFGVVDAASAPVVASHTGARALQDFPRYLSDRELTAIAATGGLVGLWPFRHRRTGVRTMAELVAHARHIATVIGPEHLAIGSDQNGIPGAMAGFGGEADLPSLTGALLDEGFVSSEVMGILGGNALRVFRAVELAGRTR